jgi:hypothetical protein
MSQQYWSEALNKAKEQLATLLARLDTLDAEREVIVNEVVQLEQAIKSLSPLTSDRPADNINAVLIENVPELTLADACREVLKKNDRYMTPIEIRDTLAASGFELNNHTNPLASIHGVLKRIAGSGDAEKHEKNGVTMYKWNSAKYEVRVPTKFYGGGMPVRNVVQEIADALASGKGKSQPQGLLEEVANQQEKKRY